jgi:protein TonB
MPSVRPAKKLPSDRNIVRPSKEKSAADVSAWFLMFLSAVFHGFLGLALFAFDSLETSEWPNRSFESAIQVELHDSQDRLKNAAPAKVAARKVSTAEPPRPEEVVSPEIQPVQSPPEVATSGASASFAGVNVGLSAAGSAQALMNAENKYLSELRQLLESKKEYPMAARRMGHRGRVVVRFVLERDGRVRLAEIVQASSSEILNRAARGLIDGLQDVKPFPKEVALAEWAVVVPIEYQM